MPDLGGHFFFFFFVREGDLTMRRADVELTAEVVRLAERRSLKRPGTTAARESDHVAGAFVSVSDNARESRRSLCGCAGAIKGARENKTRERAKCRATASVSLIQTNKSARTHEVHLLRHFELHRTEVAQRKTAHHNSYIFEKT